MKIIFKTFLLIIGLTAFSSFGERMEKIVKNLDPELGVEFPVSFGLHGKVHLNQSLYFRLGVGSSSELLLSNMYKTDLTNVNRDTANLIVDSLANSLHSNFRLGFRANRQKGFYGELGYSLMSLGRGETSSNNLSKSIGRVGLDIDEVYGVASTVHNATVHAGYLFPVFKKVALSAELGLIKPVTSIVEMDYKNTLSHNTEVQDSRKIENIIEDVLVFTGSLWLSYIF